MKVIPNEISLLTKSNAEKKIFNRFKQTFVQHSNYIVFHSLNIPNHQKKRFAEADFVVLVPHGLFVLEVKGGGVTVTDNKWYTNDIELKESPFKQAETALHALKEKIEEISGLKFDFPIGYGVIFPDVRWKIKSSEWDRRMICDAMDFQNFEGWLQKFFKFWQNRHYKNNTISDVDIKKFKQIIRPSFELAIPLYITAQNSEQQLKRLTDEQYKYLDIVADNERVLCYGGAGTGKTFLAAELAKRKSLLGKKVLFTCKSKWLTHFLEKLIPSENITISTIDSLSAKMRRNLIDQFDILIVDEGQDLFNFHDLNELDNVLKGGLENGEWYIFHDINNQKGIFSKCEIEAFEMLKSFRQANVPLNTNCRNTKPILEKVRFLLNLDMGTNNNVHGPEVYEIDCTHHNYLSHLNEILSNLLKDGFPPENITILSPVSFDQSLVKNLKNKFKNKIEYLDEYSIRYFPTSEISFSQIKDFKGLENEVIIVTDMPKPNAKLISELKAEYYVAMSRARVALYLLWLNS